MKKSHKYYPEPQLKCDRCNREFSFNRLWLVKIQVIVENKEYYVCLKCRRRIEKEFKVE